MHLSPVTQDGAKMYGSGVLPGMRPAVNAAGDGLDPEPGEPVMMKFKIR